MDAPGERLEPGLRLEILATEHWSLLSTRALTCNEAFSSATMFLSAVAGSVVALALVAGVMGFDDGFVVFALLLLPVLLFVGVSTFRRLFEIREDVRWVVRMNRLWHTYLEAAPELQPYFVTGGTDDEGGVMTTFDARPGAGSFAHAFVTTPGPIAVIDGVIAGVLAAILEIQMGTGMAIGLALAVGACVATVALLAILQDRPVIRPRGMEPSFPEVQWEASVRNRYPRPRSVRM